MTNNIHPKELATFFLGVSLEQFEENLYPVDAHGLKAEISDKQTKVIENAINGYRHRRGFSDKLKGLGYRIVQFVKAIFGKSDWNKALNTLSEFNFNETDVIYLNENEDSQFMNVKSALFQAKEAGNVNEKDYNKFITTKNKAKKLYLDHFMKTIIGFTKQKIKCLESVEEMNELEGMVEFDFDEEKILGQNLIKKTDKLKTFLESDACSDYWTNVEPEVEM